MRSIYDNVAVLGATGPTFNTASVAAVQVVTGPTVDTKGYNTAAIRIWTTAITGVIPTIQASLGVVLQESSDNSTWTTANDNTGTAIGGNVLATTPAVIAAYRVEGLGTSRKRYLRLQLTGNTIAGVGTSNCGFTSFGVIELGRAFTRPVTSTVSNT